MAATYDLSPPLVKNTATATLVFLALAIFTTVLRFYARYMRSLLIKIDDWLMLAGLFTQCVFVGLQLTFYIAGGVGRHAEVLGAANIESTYKLLVPYEIFYPTTLCLVKCSIISFYWRIFGSSKGFNISAIFVTGMVCAWALSVILEAFLLCRPFAYNWDLTLDGHCGDRNKVYVSAGALNVITDFMVMGLPIPHILKLQMAWKKKAGLLIMFGLGLFISIISIVRILSLQTIDFADPTSTLPFALFWSTLESNIAIINGNLPMVRTVLIEFSPTVFGSGGSSGGFSRRSGPKDGGDLAPFELIEGAKSKGNQQRGLKLGAFGTKNTIEGGTELTNYTYGDNESGSEKGLTNKDGITVGRSVDVESHTSLDDHLGPSV